MEALTLQDIKATLDPNGMLAKIVDTMSTSGDLSEDGIWKPTNAFGRNVTSRTLTTPRGELRRANRGVAPGKGSMGQVEDYVGYIEAVSLVDDKVLRSLGNAEKQKLRLEFDSQYAVGLAIQGRQLTIYGDRGASGEEFNGMAAKRSKLDGKFTLDCANPGQTKFTSLYVVAWDGDRGCHFLYPKETKAGISTEDFGKSPMLDPDDVSRTRLLPMWLTWFYYDLGFVVKDDRNLIRLANIDPDELSAAYANKIMRNLNKALRTLSITPDSGKVRIYGNTDMLTFFDNMDTVLPNFQMNSVQIEKKTFTQAYHGVPLRTCDEITSGEVEVEV